MGDAQVWRIAPAQIDDEACSRMAVDIVEASSSESEDEAVPFARPADASIATVCTA